MSFNLKHDVEPGTAFDAGAPEGWCQHVRFEDLMKDPIGVVHALMAQFG